MKDKFLIFLYLEKGNFCKAGTIIKNQSKLWLKSKKKPNEVVIYVNFIYICTMRKEREILYYENYFIDFFMSLENGAKKKISYVLDMLKTQERLNKNFVKLIRDGVYELRASHNGDIYRAFFIFDDGNIVMLFNGFQKKTQKTPDSEIEKALKLKNEYYASKP